MIHCFGAVLAGLLSLITSVSGQEISNRAFAEFLDAGGALFSDSTNTVITDVAVPDILLQKSADEQSAAPGDTIVYTITAENNGIFPIPEGVITDTLNAAVGFLDSSPPASMQNNVVIWNFSNFKSGEILQFTLRVVIHHETPVGTQISNLAVSAAGTIPFVSDTTIVVIDQYPDVNYEFSKTVNTDFAYDSDVLTYTIYIENNSPYPTSGTVITDILPDELTYLSSIPNGFQNGQFITWELGSLLPGSDIELVLTAEAAGSYPIDALIENQAVLTDDTGTELHAAAETILNPADSPYHIAVTPNPDMIPADGQSASLITASVTSFWGLPVPDGTQVELETTAGIWSNEATVVTLSTEDGIVSEILTSAVSTDEIITAEITATVQTGTEPPDNISDQTLVHFYPLAVAGRIMDHSTNVPVVAAQTELRDWDSLLRWSDQTDADGMYLLPVTESGEYTVIGTAEDHFGRSTGSVNTVAVDMMSGIGQSQILNHSTISGSVTNLATGVPITVGDIRIYLMSDDIRTDSTYTDENGKYAFNGLSAGTYRLQAVMDPQNELEFIQIGEMPAADLPEAVWLINADIPMHLPVLDIRKQADGDIFDAGDSVTYEIIIANPEFLTIHNLTVTDTLSDWLTLLDSTPEASLQDNVVSWNIPQLYAGASDTLFLTAQTANPIPNETAIPNRAVCSAPGLENQSDETEILVVSAPQLELTKIADIEIFPGDTLIYTLILDNIGSDTATQVTLNDTLPPELTLYDADGDYAYDDFSKVLTWVFDDMPALTSHTLTIQTVVDVLLPEGATFENTASVTCIEGSSDQSSALTTNVLPLSIELYAVPPWILGNGLNSALLYAPVYTFLGNPVDKPVDVDFTATEGTIPEALLTTQTDNGIAPSQLVSSIVLNETVISHVTATVRYGSSTYDTAETDVTFYPSAVAGWVIDYSDVSIQGAIVDVYNSGDDFVGADTTDTEGYYLIPITDPDEYYIVITILAPNGDPIPVGQDIDISDDDLNENIIITNWISISGWIIDMVTGEIIAEGGIPIILNGSPPDSLGRSLDRSFVEEGFTDTTYTDETGFYAFTQLYEGTYEVEVQYDGEEEYASMGNIVLEDLTEGYYVINANIGLDRLTLATYKEVDIENAAVGDTLTYTIHFGTESFPVADTTWLVDELPTGLEVLLNTIEHPQDITYHSYDPVRNDLTFYALEFSEAEMDSVRFSAVVTSDVLSTGGYIVNTAYLYSGLDTVRTTADGRSDADTQVSAPVLMLEKTANRQTAIHGDYVTYTLEAQNESFGTVLHQLTLTDHLPNGFKYKKGSSYLDGSRIADPVITALNSRQQQLVWELNESLTAGSMAVLKFRTVIGLNSSPGDCENQAWASGTPGGSAPVTSPVATATVLVKPDGLLTDGLIFGKVFYDENENGLHDSGEAVLPYVELILENGIRVITDEFGKYSVPNVQPGEHVIRLNRYTIPEGSVVRINSTDFMNDPWSRLTKVTPGGIAKANFPIEEPAAGDISLELCQIPTLEISLEVLNPSYRLQEFEPFEMDTHFNFDSGSAVLDSTDLETVDLIGSFMRMQEFVVLDVIGHTDNVPVSFGMLFKDNYELSRARANAVVRYLDSRWQISPQRVHTAGMGPDEPVAANSASAGRAANRRIELRFSSPEHRPQNPESLGIQARAEYTSEYPLADVRFIMSIPNGFRYVQGSARLNDAPFENIAVDDRSLIWNLGGWQYSVDQTYNCELVPADIGPIPDNGSVTGRFEYTNTVGYRLAAGELTAPFAVRADGLYLKTVTLNSRTGTLSKEAVDQLNQVAELLQWEPGLDIDIEIHCPADSSLSESPDAAQAAGMQIQEYLTDAGIARNRLILHMYGPYFSDSRMQPQAHDIIAGLKLRLNRVGSSLPETNPVMHRFLEVPVQGITSDGSCPDIRPDPLTVSQKSLTSGVRAVQFHPLEIFAFFNFESGSARLSAADQNQVRRIGQYLNWQPGVKLEIIGHTDSVPVSGRLEFADNYELSRARAENIRSFLVGDLGISESRIRTNGKGPDEPVADNSTRKGRRQNRRIELKFTSPQRTDLSRAVLELETVFKTTARDSLEGYRFTANLPSGWAYTAGSGRIAGQNTEPSGSSAALSWNLPAISSHSDLILSYSIQINDPDKISAEDSVAAFVRNAEHLESGQLSTAAHAYIENIYLTSALSAESILSSGASLHPETKQVLNGIADFLHWQEHLNLKIVGIQPANNEEADSMGDKIQAVTHYLTRDRDLAESRIQVTFLSSQSANGEAVIEFQIPVPDNSDSAEHMPGRSENSVITFHDGSLRESAAVPTMYANSGGEMELRLNADISRIEKADRVLLKLTWNETFLFTAESGKPLSEMQAEILIDGTDPIRTFRFKGQSKSVPGTVILPVEIQALIGTRALRVNYQTEIEIRVK